MEEDIKLLEKLDFIGYGKKEDIEALGRDEHVDTTTIIKNLINKYKEQEKIIELMSKAIHQLAISYDIAKNFQERYCKTWYAKDPRKCKELICEECVKNYFKKKAREENETN